MTKFEPQTLIQINRRLLAKSETGYEIWREMTLKPFWFIVKDGILVSKHNSINGGWSEFQRLSEGN